MEKIALIALPQSLAEAHPHLRDQGYYVDPDRPVVIFKATYLQHKYNPLNVLEDRALSILEQEIIHPYHGGRDSGLNILKDTKRFLKDLTDIVRGEQLGSIPLACDAELWPRSVSRWTGPGYRVRAQRNPRGNPGG